MNISEKDKVRIMAEGGKKLADVLGELIKKVRPGITGSKLDQIAFNLIKEKGGFSSFKTVKGYKHTTCLCINDVVVHGIPGSTPFKNGDILGIDIGMLYKGFHTDMSWSVIVGETNDQIQKNFLETGKIALKKAISQAKTGNRVGHISKTIEDEIKKGGFYPVQVLVGHGIGRNLHEDPQIPCFLKNSIDKTVLLKDNMTLAIEVIYNMTSHKVVYKNDDGWTISTRDGSISGLFEHTVVVSGDKGIVLTHSDKFDKITNNKTN